ncbi:MAG TPA: LPS assembly lipoprotein LptE [Thermoanaerobaculia bacterium]|nr:LPS assembly lipoprotein LptE [Thermoanaerobaculia bacterium]
MKRTSALLAALVVILSASCGYHLVGRGNIIDSSIRTINVPTLVNRTTRVEVEQQLTQEVAAELVSRGRLRLVSDPKQAHAVLRGSVSTYNLTPVGIEQGRTTQYQISITASIELVDLRGEAERVIWKNDQYRFVENYTVAQDTTDAFDQETRAIQEIAVRFAQSLVSNLLEGF